MLLQPVIEYAQLNQDIISPADARFKGRVGDRVLGGEEAPVFVASLAGETVCPDRIVFSIEGRCKAAVIKPYSLTVCRVAPGLP